MAATLAAADFSLSDLGALAQMFQVDMFSGCWRYLGRLDKDGYAVLYAEGKSWRGHRFVYTKLVGPIPVGPDGRALTLDHVAKRGCIWRDCCNPAHLEPLTQSQNTKRTIPWNRQKTHCPRGHDYAETGVYRECSDGYERRYCTACAKTRRAAKGQPSLALCDALSV